MNFCVTGLLFWLCICPDRDWLERSPLPDLPPPLPAPLPPPLPYADFAGLGLMSDMKNVLGCFDLNKSVRSCSVWKQPCVSVSLNKPDAVIALLNGASAQLLYNVGKHNTAPSNLKNNISMKCTVFTYHLA